MPLPQEINIGTAPNNGTGDPLRTAFQKSNARDVYLDERIDNLTKITFLPTVPPTGEINTLYAESSTGLLKEWNGSSYVLYGGSGGVSKPPVDADPYTDVAALLAAQNDQEEDYFYEVTDASGFTDPDITTGNAVVLLTKSPGVDATGTESDYIVVWAKEFEIGGGATYDDTAILADLATKVKKRTLKTITTTVSYTLIAEDFTDFILKFTANGSEEISVVLNSGVAPLNGELQMISTGNNKLVLSLTGVTATYPEQTNPKTILKGWLGGIVTATDTISFNGSLESTATGGTTYAPFTNTEDGLVPAPNVSGETTYGGAITFPTEGFTVTEGDTVSVTASDSSVVVGASRKKLVNESPFWVDDAQIRTVSVDSQNITAYDLLETSDTPTLYVFNNSGSTDSVNVTIKSGTNCPRILIAAVAFGGTVGGVNPAGLNILFEAGVTARYADYYINTIDGNGVIELILESNIVFEGQDFSSYYLTGDLVRTFQTFQSPNGTLKKLSINDDNTITVANL